MEVVDNEAMPSNSSGSTSINGGGELVNAAVVRGKRTKRQRPQSPLPVLALAVSANSSSASSNDDAPGRGGSLTEEEEDMANCLILLAQGAAFDPSATAPAAAVAAAAASPETPKATPVPAAEKFTSRRFAEAATTTNGKAGFYVYECKTCSKCFPSFQALGGHRTSHKKPKLAAAQADDDMLRISMSSNFSRAAAAATAAAGNVKAAKVHECSICGSEFSSGQALGGHMRRHRPLSGAGPPPPPVEGVKKEKNFLSLDLNLPAPSAAEDELQRPPSPTALSLAGGNRTLLLPAPPVVVDCHY